jgi:hypothetical protein
MLIVLFEEHRTHSQKQRPDEETEKPDQANPSQGPPMLVYGL